MNGPRIRETSSSRRRAPLCRVFALVLLLACCLSAAACAQSVPTASRLGDLQLGGGFTYGSSDYNFNKVTLTGGALYADFNNREHWGFEAGFHQVASSSDSTVYQRTYELGPRFFLARGRLAPYGKVLYGRGVYNFSANVANIAYNLYTVGGGADFALTPTLNLRADYELQSWLGFPLATLHPNLYTFGVAYHFRAFPKPPR
jgi:opacity protein-like surface antigen